MIVYDTSGRRYVLKGTNLGGGEGKLYSVEDNVHFYAKIFKGKVHTRKRIKNS